MNQLSCSIDLISASDPKPYEQRGFGIGAVKNAIDYQVVAKSSMPKPYEQRGFGIGAVKNTIDYQVVAKSSDPKPCGRRGFGIGTNWKNAIIAEGTGI